MIGEVEDIGHHEPLSEEKLCPILAMYKAKSFEDGVDKADKLVNTFGPGHTGGFQAASERSARLIAH